ncbi:MAG: IS91 family transposase [Deltaproteobacteria bacterium]|nr:IS91 family transposase [Deltaproteobacteria bacterium]RKY04662.1 MAG: IS91 family transposase [Planctomycetota bacterium]
MVELAEIFRRYGPDYINRFGSRMLPSHLQAMADIVACRTEQMGGHLYCCENPDCEHLVYTYHSCGNRSCPKCGQDKTQRWLEKQHSLLLPTHYFLLTFTLPCELRALARSNQKVVYDLLFKSSAAALQKLARDPRFVGGDIAMMGGLHTWQRDMRYHPHVHFIVPGGGLSPDRSQWLSSDPDFLVPVEALSVIFKAKFRDALKKTDLFDSAPADVWNKDWVVHCKPVGSGTNALKYLAPYVYRVAIANNRIEKLEDDRVTFRFKNSDTHQWETATLPVFDFIHRFLQHVLPKGFMKIRYYGLLAPNNKNLLTVAKYLLGTVAPEPDNNRPTKDNSLVCPHCGAKLLWVKPLPKSPRAPP